jgi:hypothetical protein
MKMNASNYALRKETEAIDAKLGQYCSQQNFLALQKRCDDFALNYDL